MRVNEPITNHEIEVPEGEPLVSRTDRSGNIVFTNHVFVETSGFTEGELVGSPHNIVRHPQMPKEAFANLWATIKAGSPLERIGEEPLQERRFLLGASECHTGGRGQ